MEMEEVVISAFKKVFLGGHGNQGRVVVWGVLGWLCLLNVSACGQFSGGSGTLGDPYLISDPNDLQAIGLNSVHWNKHFKLTANLDLTGVAMTPIGNNSTRFSGTFNGNSHTIANLTINLPVTDYVGFFGIVRNAVDPNTIFNLGLIDPDISGQSSVGALVGRLEKGTFSNCYADSGSVNGVVEIGGLFGISFGTIRNCYVVDTVTGTGSSAGGLVGEIRGGTIRNCYATGSITGTLFVGGLAGFNNSATISNCYSIGDVNGTTYVGGLVGVSSNGTIRNCYSIGLVNDGVSGANVSGLLGRNTGIVFNSYWATDSSGQATSAGGIGKLLVEMKQAATFFGWGCDPVWTIDEGIDTPRLVWENAVGTLITNLPAYGGGSGTSNDPYLISNGQDLLDLNLTVCDWDKHFKLNAYLDLTGIDISPIGTISNPFTGTFDGNGYSIANLTIHLPRTDYVGLFGFVDNSFDPNAIFNLGLIDPDVTGDDRVGALVGQLDNGTMSSCYAEGGSVDGRVWVGGLVGFNTSASINFCTVSSSVNGRNTVGGLVGFNSTSGTISDCSAIGPVNGPRGIGGLVGSNSGTIRNCTATGAVDGRERVGGLAASNTGTISNSYATGAVTGRGLFVGGLVGVSTDGTINNCNATGTVTGTSDYVGGLVGEIINGTVINCTASGSVTGTNLNVGGLVGYNDRGTISNCYATGTVDGIHVVGGLVGGSIVGTISDCYATGAVSGTGSNVGGLVGIIDRGTIRNCYATGVVNGTSRVGGLVGYNNNGTISNSYAIGLVNNGFSKADVGGLVGYSNTIVFSSYWATDSSGQTTSAGGIGKTLVEMKQAATFFGWGCDAVWTIDEGIDTPRLVWENAVGTLITNLPAYGGGSGTPNDPFLISTAQDLLDLSLTICDWDKHFELIFDPNMAGIVFTPIGNPVFPFTGTLDGNGHTIANLTINTVLGGLFGVVDNTVDSNAIFDLGLINPDITGNWDVGALVGLLKNGTLSGCYADGGSVSGDSYVGGLVGQMSNGILSGCYVDGGSVNGDFIVGGLVGWNNSGTISDCYAAGQINGGFFVGGLVGENGGTIRNCYVTGVVNGTSRVGGLVGYNNNGTINDSYATGAINGDIYVGGLVGRNYNGTISDCTATGAVIGTGGDTYVGGLVGENLSNGTISDCTATGPVTGSSRYVGGLVGRNTSGTISDCTTTGTVSGAIGYAGGLVGVNRSDGAINNCTVTGSVTGTGKFVGGLVGSNNGTISNCTATSAINGYDYVGGLVGSNFNGTISGCAATGAVMGGTGRFGHVGGLVGRNINGTISNCYATGTVDGIHVVGGLVGGSIVGTISDCYATGAVSGTGSNVGGLVGIIDRGTISDSYATGSVTGIGAVGGLVGFDNGGTVDASLWDTQTSGQASSAGGTGKTTAEMQMASTFLNVGWDFVGESINGTEDIWTICGGVDYPRFVWEIVAREDLVCPEHMRVWFTPQRFNPMSQGKWIRGHVIMPEGIEPADIDPAIMVRLAPWGILSDEVEVMMDESGRVELTIAFDRAEVLAALEAEAENHSVGITLIGAFTDGSSFYASSAISILESRVNHLHTIASHWLSEDCSGRGWCEGADVNQDGVVNYLDYILEASDFIYIFAND